MGVTPIILLIWIFVRLCCSVKYKDDHSNIALDAGNELQSNSDFNRISRVYKWCGWYVTHTHASYSYNRL
jgi:hypothetical protein